jgi:hypothetical protein
LEDDGFLRKRVAAPEESQVTKLLENDMKKRNDDDVDEDLFEFPSDKRAKLTAGKPADEDDEDIFAFADEVKPKPLQAHIQKDQPAESSEFPKKRKLKNSEIISEPSSKRHALEKGVLQTLSTESHKNEPIEHTVTLHGFLSIVQEGKVIVFITSSKVKVSTYLQ